jgi:hypothetical protein
MTGPADETGHFEIAWRPHGAATEAAPAKTAIQEQLLGTLPRAGRGIVAFPGFVRYRLGHRHIRDGQVWRYLHRVDPGGTT